MFIDQPLLNEIKDVIGKCDDTTTFRRISDAVRLLNNKYKGNDWNVGVMDICAYDGAITLPADVANVLGVVNGGQPTLLRDQWFQFHANGPGTNSIPWGYTDDLGPFSTYRDPSAPVKLVAIVENQLDSNRKLRVYGYDSTGKRIYTRGASGLLEDGILVPTIYGFPAINPEAPSISKIERVQKDVTNGYVKLIAVDSETLASHTQIGYYAPWETVPTYRRIRVTDRTWVRVKYRRKDIEVRGLQDWINIDNRPALLMMMKSLQFKLNDQSDKAAQYEMDAMNMLSEEADSTRPPAINGPQIVYNDWVSQDDTMFP